MSCQTKKYLTPKKECHQYSCLDKTLQNVPNTFREDFAHDSNEKFVKSRNPSLEVIKYFQTDAVAGKGNSRNNN